MSTETIERPEVDESLLATLTAEERAAYLEGLDDPDMQDAIEEASSMSEDEMKAALAGKDEPKTDEGTSEKKPEQGATTQADDAESTARTASQPEAEETFRPVLRADLPANIGQIKTQLQQQQDALERQFRDGDIEFDEYKAKDRKLSADLEQIKAAELKAHIYADQEQQRAVQEWQFTVRQFMKQAKGDGVDYQADQKLNKDLDLMVKALANDPDNEARDQEWFLQEAHKRVLAVRGITPKGAKADPAAVANAARRPPVASLPKTVGDLPGAGDLDDVAGGEFASIDKLTGEAYERALAKMSDEQRARYLAG